jgi:hypothetical protein
MAELYDKGFQNLRQDGRAGGLAGQADPATANFNEETKTYLDSLSPEERQLAVERINAPLTGEDVFEALKQDMDYAPTLPEYLKYVAYNKTHESSLLDGIGEGVGMVLDDLGRAAGAVADHPMKALAKAPPSLIEAFAQGTRNLYGMLAQSANPDSVLFGLKNAIAGDGSPEGYNQFLAARKFNKHSARLASGEDTIVMDKDVIDHDITLAMSYIADPTLFVPFGAGVTAGMRAVGLGEKVISLGGRAAAIKSAIIGGGLKWGVGAPIEFIGNVTKGTIDKAVTVGGNVLETASGIPMAELRQTARLSAIGTTTSSILGGHIPVVSTISNVYVGAGVASGVGEAVSAVGNQMLRQGGKRGHLSFAREALLQTPNLSAHAKGLLKVIDAVDPMFSYGYSIAEGAGQGAMIGGTLGYLSGGKEGLGHGIGAGVALGAVGAGAGRLFADISGGTKMARAEVQGGFKMELAKASNDPNYKGLSAFLERQTLLGDRAGALQVIGGLDRIAPDMRMLVGRKSDAVALLKSHGLDSEGYKIDKDTGLRVVDAQGKPVKYGASVADWYGGEGFVMFTDMDASGKKRVTIHMDTESAGKNTMHHELFHAVFRSTMMERHFKDGFSKAILGEFDENGKKVKPAEIDPKEFRKFARRELQFTRDENGNRLPVAEVKKRLAEFDAHLAEYEKAGSTARMNPDSARALDYLVEEFGAHYFTQFLKGKSVDYLFHGAEFTGMRGVMDRVQNGFIDFWQGGAKKQRPTFDFDKGFDVAFGTDGKRTAAQRSSAIDFLAQDLIRSVAGKRKGSSNSLDVRTLSPEARKAFFESSGIDGLKHFYDKNGQPRGLTEAQVKQERLEVGKAIHDSLSKLDPKIVAGLLDVDGNFNASSTLGTRLNDTILTHLVKEGHISQLLADRIKNVQDIVEGKGSNVVSYLYHGASQETQVGPNSPRLYGADVPITSRETIVVGYDIKVKKDGTLSLVMKGLDKKVIDMRGNTLWADPAVRDLWQGDRNAFDQSFFDYLSNASKASTDRTRVESSLLPSLARGDGFGGERRNVMHQFLGMAKRQSESYFNKPIAEIPRGKTSTVFNQSMDLMTPMKSDLPTRYEFNLENAHRDLSKNFKVSDMEVEKTPVGNIFTHASGYKITADAKGTAHLYDNNGKSLGSFKDKDLASVAMEKTYAAERAETEVRIQRVQEDQQKRQASFKVFDDQTLAKGRELGDIFATDEGKAFHRGTSLIRQTREEFFSSNFHRLRQADAETVFAITEDVAKRGYALRELRTQAYDKMKAEEANGRGREYKKARDAYDVIVSHADRYNDILLAYERATKSGRNGQAILDFINTHRRTSIGYDNMAKVFFGDSYDSQFQTGKPVTTVATHGTSSHELIASREFDPKQFGTKHGADHDKVGVFLSGETKTSFGYADPKEGDTGYRQVRAAVKFNNPLVVDADFKCYSPDMYDRYIKQVRDGGHDGVIIKNVYDGGSADTVFIVMSDKVKDNTAIIDTHIGMEKVDTVARSYSEDNQGSIRYPIQESMPRGKDVRVGTDVGLSWKVADTVARESGYDKFLKEAGLSGRLRKGVKSEEFAGRPVVLINYDNSGVWNLIDGSTGEVISKIQGGALHNIISGKINPDKQAAVLASVDKAGLNKIEAVRQRSIKAGNPLTFLLISGRETKSFSHPQVGGAVTSLLAKFVQSKAIDPAEVNTIIKAMSEAFVVKDVKNDDGTTSKVRVPQGDLLKPLIGRPAAEQIAFLEKNFFPQDKSTFSNRGETMDRLVQTLATLPSVKKNKDYFQKFFNNPEMKMSGEGFRNEILKLTDEPITRTQGGEGESLGYGKVVAALEVPQNQAIIAKVGGHEGFPMDYRSDKGKGKTTPAVMSVFEVPRRLTDMISPPHGREVSTHYISKSGKLRSSSELLMTTTATFGEGIVREGSHGVRKDTLNLATTKDKILAGEPKYKVSETKAEHITQKRRDLLVDLPRYREMMIRYRDKLLSGELGKDLEVDVDNPALSRGADFRNHLRGVDLMIESIDSTIAFEEKTKSRGEEGYYSKERTGRMGDLQVSELFRSVESFAGTEFLDKTASVRGNQRRQYEGFKRFMEAELTKDYANPTFYSALNQTVENIFSKTVGKDEAINPARLLNLIKNASGGDIGRIMTEADAIGLTEFLKAKGQKKTSIKEIRDFIDTNKIEIEVDPKTTGVEADFGDTSPYRAVGAVEENHTFIARINPKYAHGVSGHFGAKGDVVVHVRATIRVDAEGRRVLFIEEIQSQNAQAKQVPQHEVKQIKKDMGIMTEFRERMKASRDAFERLQETTPFGERQATIKADFINESRELYKKYIKELPETYRKRLQSDLETNIEVLGKEEGETVFFNNLQVSKTNDYGQSKDSLFNLLYNENKLKLSRAEDKGVNAPLQDFKETVKIASRTAMRQAIELGADRVVFVESKDTHPDVDMRNQRGQQLYDKDIPAMVASDIKKFGGELKPANNLKKSQAYETSDTHDTHEILSRSRGYDVTPAMKETLKGQPAYKVSDAEGYMPPSFPSMDEMMSNILEHTAKAKSKEQADDNVPKRYTPSQMEGEFVGRVAKENPKLTKDISVRFKKLRSSKFGTEYKLSLYKDAPNGSEVFIGSFTSEIDGNSAASGMAEIKEQFRNKGYGRLLYSEMAERLREQGARSWGGRMIDQKRRPQTLRETVIDQENARIGYQDSETRLSDERQDYNGDKTFFIESKMHGKAHYKTSDAEYRPDIKPFEGNYKVSDSVKKGVSILGKFIDDNADTANISPDIKNAMKVLREAVRKQDATDEVLEPEVREAYDKIVASVEEGISRPALTPVATLKELQKILKPLDKGIEKNSQRISKKIRKGYEEDMAEGADLEAEDIQQAQATNRRDMDEGADLDSNQSQQSDLEVGADVEAGTIPAPSAKYPAFPYPAPATPTIPKRPVAPSSPPPASASQLSTSIYPSPFPKNLPPAKPMGKLEGWRGWTLEKGLNGGFWKNAVGWMIVVQGDKFKVYNPQKALQGIYQDLDQAKRRVQRAEPKQ